MTQIRRACSSVTDDNTLLNSVTDEEYDAKLTDDKYGVK
jgi:hypothetical protein